MANRAAGTSSARARRACFCRGTSDVDRLPGRWRVLWSRRLLTGPSAAAEAAAEQLLHLGRSGDHVEIHRVVPRVDHDRPDPADPLTDCLLHVYALELRVRNHVRVLVEDPFFASDF